MLDLKFIRENADAVAENCKNRYVDADVGLVVELADRAVRVPIFGLRSPYTGRAM